MALVTMVCQPKSHGPVILCHSPSDGVDLLNRNLQLLDGVDCLRSKRLVAVNRIQAVRILVQVMVEATHISQRSTSSFEMPAFSRTLGMAKAGPIPMTLAVKDQSMLLVLVRSAHDLPVQRETHVERQQRQL